MLAFLLRVICGVGFLVLLPGTAVALWHMALAGPWTGGMPLLIGLGIGAAVYLVLLRHLSGIEIFEHEMTHALVALCYFRKLTNFTVRMDGGHVKYEHGFGGTFGDDMIAFAPYVLPTLTAMLILIRPFLPAGLLPVYDPWVGGTFGYHLLSSWRELHPGQRDLKDRSLLYALVAVPALGLALHGVLLAILLHGYAGVPQWALLVWQTTLKVAAQLGMAAR